MANVCIYQIKVKGAELNCHKLIDMMPLYEGEKHIYLKENEGHECVLMFSGDCKWSVDSYTNRRMEVELFTSAELEKIEDGDYWDMPLAQKAQALGVEIWCCSKDSDEGGPVIYEHYDKSGNLVPDKCPGEIALKKGHGRAELNMPLETLYNVKFSNGGTYSYHGNGVEYEIGDLVNVEGAKKGIHGQIIGTERTRVHSAHPIIQKLGHCTFFSENDFEEIWKSLKPAQREKMFMLYGTEKMSKVQYLQYQFAKWLEFAIEEDNWNRFVEECKSFLKENEILVPVNTEAPSKKRENKKTEKESADIKNLRKLWAFRATKDGGLCLTGYKGTDTEITLPYRIGEKEVTAIKWKGNADHPVTHINIPGGIKCIGTKAFDDCNLTAVYINDGVMEIAMEAFSGCTNLASVHIPESVTNIDSAFIGCTNLTSVHIPESVTNIDSAFIGCTNLTSVHIPKGVTRMRKTFRGCTNLTSVHIPEGVTNIDFTFDGCTNLTSVHIPEGVTSIDYAFSGCTNLTSVHIPESVTSMQGTFDGCTNLTSVHIPESVTNIDYAFYGCTNLTSVHIPSSVTDINMYPFSECTNLTSIHIPSSVTYISRWAFGDKNDYSKVTFYVPSGSYAETYAKENGISFVVE